MKIKDIVKECDKLRIYESREETDNYAEIVLYNSQQKEFTDIFVALLGEPIKKSGENPTSEHSKLTKDYQDITVEQTLFKKDFDSYAIIAMFWPWGDGKNTTVKIALLKNKPNKLAGLLAKFIPKSKK